MYIEKYLIEGKRGKYSGLGLRTPYNSRMHILLAAFAYYYDILVFLDESVYY